jgi:hypothetical protein
LPVKKACLRVGRCVVNGFLGSIAQEENIGAGVFNRLLTSKIKHLRRCIIYHNGRRLQEKNLAARGRGCGICHLTRANRRVIFGGASTLWNHTLG